MELIHKNKENCKFAFLGFNRIVLKNNELMDKKKKNGVQVPIIVVRGSELEHDVELFDAVSNQKVVTEEERNNSLVVLDGQHRVSCWLSINNEDENQEHNLDIPVIIKSIEEVGNINEFIVSINNTSKKWKGADYIDNAFKQCKEDEIVKAIYAFKNLGFSLSSISRYMCLNKDYLNPCSLSDYVNQGVKINRIDYKRAVKIYLFLLKCGFSNNYLKSRYLIDYIMEQKKQDDLDIALNKIYYISDIKSVCSLKDGNEIEKLVDKDYKNVMEKNKKEVLAGENIHRLNEISDEEVDLFIRKHIENQKKIATKYRRVKSNEKSEKQVKKEEIDKITDKVEMTHCKMKVVE